MASSINKPKIDIVAPKRVPVTFADFKEFVRKASLPIYIFGADIAGKAVAHLLTAHDMKVTAFLDNNKNKCTERLNGVEVLSFDEVSTQIRPESVILIASTYISDIIDQLEGEGFFNWAQYFLIDHFNDVNFRAIVSGELQKSLGGISQRFRRICR